MLTLYNTLARKKEPFQSITPKKVGMYVCGLTVYDYAHIGNYKSFLTADILRRRLVSLGYEVVCVKNITDVGHLTRDDISQGDSGEDKLEMKAKSEHKTPKEIAQFYETYLHESEKAINILPATHSPHATEHIPQMIRCIETLLAKGHAYEKNGNVFYDVSTFSNYGKLSGNTLERLKTGARLERHPDKKNDWDFALWLKAPEGHLMRWDSPWGVGYPGWHIECSAMSSEYLGEMFDIHTGGEDHIFPHHEAEIAQTEGMTEKSPCVRYWIHTRHLLVEGKKMSKSKGNVYRLEDLVEKGYDAMHLRLSLLFGHYRSQTNFTWDTLEQAKRNFTRIHEWVQSLQPSPISQHRPKEEDENAPEKKIHRYEEKFWDAVDDDLNIPAALSILYELITFTHKHTYLLSSQTLFDSWSRMNAVLGFIFSLEKEPLPKEVSQLLAQRNLARENREFKKSDEFRRAIELLGYTVEDSPQGTTVKKSLT